MEEKRKAKRVKLKSKILVEGEEYFTNNVSETGCLIIADTKFNLGKEYKAVLNMQNVELGVKLHFVESKGKKHRAEFIFLNRGDRYIVGSYILQWGSTL
jgi:hypothetical protein